MPLFLWAKIPEMGILKKFCEAAISWVTLGS